MAICKRRTAFLSNTNIDPNWIISACEEYGCFVEQPYPDVYNLGLMSLNAGGIPCDCDQDFIVKIFTPGDLGTSKWLWCQAADEVANNNWFGRNPIFHSIWEKIADNSGGTDYYEYDVIQTGAGRVFLAVDQAVGADHDLKFYEIDCDTHAMTLISTIDVDPAPNSKVLLVYAPDHELIFAIFDMGGGTSKIKRSSDNGLTWVQIYFGTDFTIPLSCKYSKNVLYLAYSNAATFIRIKQSIDFGTTWTTIETQSDRRESVCAMCVLDNGDFGLLIQNDDTDKLYFQTAAVGSIFGGAVEIHDYAGPLEASSVEIIEGTIIVITWDSVNFADYFISTDDGATWSAQAKLHYHVNGGIFSSIDNFKLRKVNSKPVFLSNGLSTTKGIIWFWGYEWSNVTETLAYPQMYDAVALPNNGIFGWLVTLIGTGIMTAEADLELLLDTGAGLGTSGMGNLGLLINSYLDTGGKVRFGLKSTAGNSGHLNSFHMAILINDSIAAGNGMQLEINICPTDLRLYDDLAIGYIGTQYNHDFTHYHDFLLAYKTISGTRKISLWFKEESEIEWTNIETNLTISGAVIPPNNYMELGVVRVGILPHMTAYLKYYYATDNIISGDDGLADGFVNPTDLVGALTIDDNSFVTEGINVIFSGQDAVLGDKWEVKTAYQYAVENILTDSPSEYWRTDDDEQDCNIVFDSGDCDFPWNGTALINTNFRTAYLEGDPASTFDSGPGATPKYQIALDALLDTGEADAVDECWIQDMSKYYKPHQWKGKFLRFTSGAASGNTYLIDDNSEHSIYAYGETFVTDGVVATDDFVIFGDRMGGELAVAGALSRERYTRIRIPNQKTADGYYKIGKFIAGYMHEINPCMEWNFTDGAIPNIGIIESKGGMRYGSKRGERRRTFSVRYTGAMRDLREELTALFDYLDYSLEPFVFWEDTEYSYNDLRLVRAMGNLTYQNQILFLPVPDPAVLDRVDETEAIILEEEL